MFVGLYLHVGLFYGRVTFLKDLGATKRDCYVKAVDPWDPTDRLGVFIRRYPRKWAGWVTHLFYLRVRQDAHTRANLN